MVNTRVITLEAALPWWHWCAHESCDRLRAALGAGGDLSTYHAGAVGRGFYAALSAVDSMDRGPAVVHGTVQAGTRIYLVWPHVHGVGIEELFAPALARLGLRVQPDAAPPTAGPISIANPAAGPAIEAAMDAAGAAAALYGLGMGVSLLVRRSGCLELANPQAAIESVWAYHEAHPRERPMLEPHAVQAWLAANPRRA